MEITSKKSKSETLGSALLLGREIKGLSLRGAANAADITPTYLKKLESDDVAEPSPNILYRLARLLSIDYAQLMRLAGYALPDPKDNMTSINKREVLSHAFMSKDLTDEDVLKVVEFLKFIKSQKQTS